MNGEPHRKPSGKKGEEKKKGFNLLADVRADIRLKKFTSGMFSKIKLDVDFLGCFEAFGKSEISFYTDTYLTPCQKAVT